MPKNKTRKSAAKRFHCTGSGDFKRRQAYRSHLLTKKPQKRKKGMRIATYVSGNDKNVVREMVAAKSRRRREK